MKKCPKCNSVFTPENIYCLSDGTPLIEENFPLPSSFVPGADEEETVVRSAPVVIGNFSKTPPPPAVFQPSPQPAPPKSHASNYFLFLVLGSIVGAGLVLGGIFLLIRFSGGLGAAPEPNSGNMKPPPSAPTASEKHLTRNKTRKDDEFNGLVDTESANLRSAPNSGVQDVLPKNDRIEIIERENPTSPWYRVMCEHGVTGWMHGNTIKFADDSEAF